MGGGSMRYGGGGGRVAGRLRGSAAPWILFDGTDETALVLWRAARKTLTDAGIE